MKAEDYKCRDCGWIGNEPEYDTVETCMGNDKIEICPECGSMNVMANNIT